MSKELRQRVVEFMKAGGIDDIGILPVERAQNAEPGYMPQDLMPDVKSIIIYYIRQFKFPRLETMQQNNTPLGMIEYTANFFIGANLIDQLAYRTCCLINDEGYDAFPISSGPPYNGVKLRGLLSHKYMSELAGLTQRAMSGVTVSERFGPRIRLGAILTNAELSELTRAKPQLCEPDKCGEACAKACPTGAISREKLDLNACDRYNEIVVAFGPSKIRCGRCLDACPLGHIKKEG